MTLLAVRGIDLAIFGTLGSLWIGGAVFIYLLYRWIARFERATEPTDGADASATVGAAVSRSSPRGSANATLPAGGLASTPS